MPTIIHETIGDWTKPSEVEISEGEWGKGIVYREKHGQKHGKSAENVKDRSKDVIKSKTSKISQAVSSSSQRIISEGDEELFEDEEERQDHTILPYLFASLFGTILEDTATQLKILAESSNEIKIIKTKSDWNHLLVKKFGVEQPASVDELAGIDPKNLGCNEYKINKLDADRQYIIDVVQKTYVDLSLHKSYKALEDSVYAIVARDKYRVELAEEEARNRVLRRDLTRQLRQLRNHIKTVLYDVGQKIDDLIAQCEDAVLVSECRKRYIDNWQNARTEQHEKTIDDKEFVYTDSVDYYKQRTDHEHRIHMEVEMLMSIHINDTLEKVEEWMTKYENNMEAIDLKIQIMKCDYQNMLDKRIELQELYRSHEEEMTDWIHFKDEREKARLYRVKMTNAALAVQAWWRGILVRRQLGPYKVKKKKKPPKK